MLPAEIGFDGLGPNDGKNREKITPQPALPPSEGRGMDRNYMRGQLERLDEKVSRKRSINEFYRKYLGEFPGIEFMPEALYGRSNCWLTVILITPEEFGTDREAVRLALEAENMQA